MPTVKISAGELCDKITILEIKYEKFPDNVNVKTELHHLDVVYGMYYHIGFTPWEAEIVELMCKLKDVNLELWNVEDHLRELEREQNWGNEFIEYARSVYRLNDKRAELKRKINDLDDSEIVEEKFYAKY